MGRYYTTKNLVLLGLLATPSFLIGGLQAQELLEPAKQYSGLYYDRSSNQYFINDKVSFSIRPLQEEKYPDKIHVSVDNGPYQDYTGNIQFESDGFHLVRFKAVDPVHNWSPVQTFRIYVDLSIPSSHANWSGPSYSNGSKLFVGKDSKLVFSAQDNLSGVSKIFWQKNTEENYKTFRSGLTFSEGDHELRFSAIDNVGNMEPWKNFKFTVDSTPPMAEASVRGSSYQIKNKLFIDKGSFISIKGSDLLSGVNRVEYRLNKGPISIYNDKIAIDQKKSIIKFRAVDNVENKGNWQTLTVHLDSTPPKLAVKKIGKYEKLAGKLFARAGFTLAASMSDKESGEKTLLIDNDHTLNVKNKKVAFTQEGKHNITFGSEDNVGNSSNAESYTVVIDETPPTTKAESSLELLPKDGLLISSLPNKIDFRSLDTGVGVDYIEASYNGKKFFRVKGPIDLATWKKRKQTIYYRSVDKLGNKEPVKEMAIYVRKNGPKVGLFVEKEDQPAMPLSEFQKKAKSGNKRKPASKD